MRHEVFFENAPFEDYETQEVVYAFEEFGDICNVQFHHDSMTGELTGSGYVRFKDHEAAEALVERIQTPEFIDEPENMKAQFSMSEEMQLDEVGPNPSPFMDYLESRVRAAQSELQQGRCYLYSALHTQDGSFLPLANATQLEGRLCFIFLGTYAAGKKYYLGSLLAGVFDWSRAFLW
jgi:hypothetical protein